jgi:hypothetical protein
MTKVIEFSGEKPGFEYSGDLIRVDAKAGVPVMIPMVMDRAATIRFRFIKCTKPVGSIGLKIDSVVQDGKLGGDNPQAFGPSALHYSPQNPGKHEIEFTPYTDGQFIVIASW